MSNFVFFSLFQWFNVFSSVSFAIFALETAAAVSQADKLESPL